MSHRLSGARDPLIWSTQRAIFAVDPETGALRWRAHIAGVRRLFRLHERLFVLNAQGVSCLDAGSGEPLGTIELGFVPTTGLASREQLFFAGPTGAAALSPSGQVLWSVKEEAHMTSERHFLSCEGPDGFPLWREEVRPQGSQPESPGLVYGEQVEQPSIGER